MNDTSLHVYQGSCLDFAGRENRIAAVRQRSIVEPDSTFATGALSIRGVGTGFFISNETKLNRGSACAHERIVEDWVGKPAKPREHHACDEKQECACNEKHYAFESPASVSLF